ncbi:hypothetical protein FRC10_010312 [Ceratobasidium sp. 414]|nr:hypothetical protein FRC10_010312 [Ceratobasidium sp. 414]
MAKSDPAGAGKPGTLLSLWLDEPTNTGGYLTAGNVEDVRPPTVFSRHSKFFFDNTLIAIGIEGTLFNVHKYQLMKSTTFSDMFAIAEESKDSDTPQEGSSPDHPIVMEGVSAPDFECLMTVLYASQWYAPPSHFSAHQPEPEASLIIPAFRLANMWNFAELCAYLKPLAERVLGDVDKIVFAREFAVTEWLAPAHANLCLREKRLTTQEAGKLGLDNSERSIHGKQQNRQTAPMAAPSPAPPAPPASGILADILDQVLNNRRLQSLR